MMNNSKTVHNLIAVAMVSCSVLLSACTTEPVRVEADFGNSVNQMVQASTYDPEAAASTESVPVIGMDGKRAMRTLDAMQTDTERPQDFDDIIDIELGD